MVHLEMIKLAMNFLAIFQQNCPEQDWLQNWPVPRGAAAAVLAGSITVGATSLEGVVLMNATLNASTTTIDRHQRQALQKLIDVLISTAIANSGKT